MTWYHISPTWIWQSKTITSQRVRYSRFFLCWYLIYPYARFSGLMQPLVPVAAPVMSSPDNVNSAPAAVGTSASTDSNDEWQIEYSEIETNKYAFCKNISTFVDFLFESREIARGSFGIVYQGTFRGTEVSFDNPRRINSNLMLSIQGCSKKIDSATFLTWANERLLGWSQYDEVLIPTQFYQQCCLTIHIRKLHHPNVVLLIGVCVKEPNLCIITGASQALTFCDCFFLFFFF